MVQSELVNTTKSIRPNSTCFKKALYNYLHKTAIIMADSAVAKKGDKKSNGIDLLKQSKDLFPVIMYHFREFHDLCMHSGLYPPHSVIDIDTIAITFRKLGYDTATVATVVSNQWLESTIMFYQNLDDFGPGDLKSMLILLGGQAKELSKIFKIIARWTSWMAGDFHDAQIDTIKHLPVLKKKIEDLKQAISNEINEETMIILLSAVHGTVTVK